MTDSSSYTSVSQRYQGPWIAPETLAALPQLGRDYLRAADPERDAMIRHAQKPEPQRRRESVAYEARLSAQRRPAKASPKWSGSHGEQSEDGRGEQSGEGRGSSMVGKEKPAPKLRPPEHIAHGPDRSAFKFAWLREQKDAAFAAQRSAQAASHAQETIHQPIPPSRSEPTQG